MASVVPCIAREAYRIGAATVIEANIMIKLAQVPTVVTDFVAIVGIS